jgi:hypothetical protein
MLAMASNMVDESKQGLVGRDRVASIAARAVVTGVFEVTTMASITCLAHRS